MKSILILKNTGTAKKTEIILNISYFILEDEKEKIVTQEFYFILNEEEQIQEIDLGDFIIEKREVTILIKKTEGSVITQKTIPFKRLNNQEIEIEISINEEIELTPPDKLVEISKPNFVYGRLLDKKGSHKMEDVQLIILVKESESDELKPITAIRTEAKGYFSFDYPDQYFVQAFAQIGLELNENPIPIRLEESDQESKFIFPKRIVLVAEITESEEGKKDEDCGCNSLNFDKKRVLEEFSYFTLVRTSEPEIKGYVLEDEDELSLAEILRRLPYSVYDLIDSVKKLPIVAIKSPVDFSVDSSLSAEGLTRSRAATTTNNPDDDFQTAINNIKVRKGVLTTFLKDEKSINRDNIGKLLAQNEAANLKKVLTPQQTKPKPLGRVELNSNNIVDWDDEPTIYQTVEVAHGHLLQFKTEWIADGFSLGDLLYSLPLAPGQKKQIVVFDWERREAGSNIQSIDYEEGLSNSLSRDRDIFEIANGTISEKLRGSSKTTTASASAGLFGSFFGVSGGVGYSKSSASQDNLRQVASSDHQKLRDRITQSANAVRSLRSTVIQTVSQGERFEVSSESVANYNHCHAITIQYYEVLRHFKIRQRFSSARECLFVPLIMSQFDLKKALRWKEPLQLTLLDESLTKAFDAGNRIEHRWNESDFPSGTFASENIIMANGMLNIRFELHRPIDNIKEVDDKDREPVARTQSVVYWHKKKVSEIIEANWKPIEPYLEGISPKQFYEDYLADAKDKDEVFHRMLGEKIARSFIKKLAFYALDENATLVKKLSVDVSITSRYHRNGNLRISFRVKPPNIPRERFHYLKINSTADGNFPDNTVNVQSGLMKYKTQHFDGFLFRSNNIGDDLARFDGVAIYTGPTDEELRDPRKEDVALTNELIAHLNDNLEYYHKAIWMNMTPERRFMLLDGIILNGKGDGRSIASLVENQLLTIVGNSLVLPVAPGLNLNPDFGDKVSLDEFYAVATAEPSNISIPTKGVFAESVMGHCNSCEEKDESRFWRWEEAPIPDSPTAISPINTDTRRATPLDLTPQQFPNPMVNIQNAPNAPDPTGLANALNLLGKGDAFRDVTGLDQNQKNALAALQSSFNTTEALAKEGAKLEAQRMMEKRLDTALNKINSSDHLDNDQKKELTEKAFNAYLGGGAEKKEKKTDEKTQTVKQRINAIDELIKNKTIPKDLGEAIKKEILESEMKPKEKRTTEQKAEGLGKVLNNLGGGEVQVTSKGIDGSEDEISISSPEPSKFLASSQRLPNSTLQVISNVKRKIPTGLGGIQITGNTVTGQILFTNFDINSSQLKPEFTPALQWITQILNSSNHSAVALFGRASQTGTEAWNLHLSEERADSIYQELYLGYSVDYSKFVGIVGLGSTTPIRDNRGYEDPLNRSVELVFTAPLNPPKPIKSTQPTPTNNGTDKWAIRITISGGVSFGIGGAGFIAELKNRDTGQIKQGKYLAGGYGAGLSTPGVNPGWGSWSNFTTNGKYKFSDFDGTPCRFTDAGIGLFLFGYSEAFVSFPFLGANSIDVGGFNMGMGGVTTSTTVGYFWL